MILRVLMLPTPNPQKPGTSGIDRVVEAYFKYLPEYDVEPVSPDSDNYDLAAVHISARVEGFARPLVLHNHGLHWSGDYACETWQYKVNADIVHTLRYAKEVTVPSKWVCETFERDLRFSPHVVPHGIDWFEWDNDLATDDYILWSKNRSGDVCDPTPVLHLARQFRDNRFATTYLPKGIPTPNNISPPMGTIPYPEMKKIVQRALVYLSTTKETFGIGVLEAMASGVPVLGFAHGGNVNLIRHGETGYLAKPGDYDDLAEGLAFCLRYRDTLGDNGREAARGYSWRDAVEQVAGIYRLALESDDRIASPLVCTTIPCHNKADTIARAIQSVQRQTLNNLVCHVINDASTDDSERIILETIEGDARFRYHKVDFRNVACVRNLGASLSDAPFINFLDGDDWMEDAFLEVCIQPLLKNPSLAVAYTSLRWYKPDGSTGISQWPGEFNYDNQLRKQNQCPTCSIIRRKCWERLGGQNPKYSVLGAGAEDAEWYLRMGAYGWDAKKATDEALFNYSWQSGIVSGNPHYQEPPWLDAHPWTQDRLHPFASVATPAKLSHPVRQYDEPTVSVIIPVGPGHEEKVKDALNSLEAQTFRKWEAIVVWDTGKFRTIDPEQWELDDPKIDKIDQVYPYIKTMWTGHKAPFGPGVARNIGAMMARAPFLLFLDADDELYPTHIEKHLKAWKEHQAIIYSDYVGKAFVENPADLDSVLQERLYHRNERTGETIIGYRTADYDCERAQAQPEGHQPYLWCNVTALIPKTWFDEIGGFDESMLSWEDVDYHWRLAKSGKCYHRIPEELMVYRFHTGQRKR